MPNTATEKQIQYINSLAEARAGIEVAEKALEYGRQLWRLDAFTKDAASEVIDLMKKVQPPQREEAPEGMHRLGSNVYKVQRSIHGTGRVYAKRLEDGRFVYAPGVVKRLSPQTVLTLEEAQELGRLYGTCVVCGRTLTNEQSIEMGIGPVCRGRL